MSLESEAFNIPEQDYDAMLTMDASECAKLFKDLYQLADTVSIEAAGGKMTFTSEGEAGKSKTVISESESTKFEVKQDVKQAYAVRYLNMFNKAAVCSDTVKIRVSAAAPIVVTYELGALGEIKYYLAPKKAGAAADGEDEKAK